MAKIPSNSALNSTSGDLFYHMMLLHNHQRWQAYAIEQPKMVDLLLKNTRMNMTPHKSVIIPMIRIKPC